MDERIEYLWRRWADDKDPDARKALMEEYYPWMRRTAIRYARSLAQHADVGDLIGAASIGLIQAVDSFDYRRGIPFEGFAKMRVTGAMTDHLRRGDWAPTRVRNNVKQYWKAVEVLSQKNGEKPSIEEVAEYAGVSSSEVSSWLSDGEAGYINNLDASIELGLEPVSVRQGPEDEVVHRHYVRHIRECMYAIPDKHRYVLEMYYYGGWDMLDISESLGVTISRVSQLHKEAVRYLREAVLAS